MKNIDQIKERFLKEPFNMRLGHLASDLARIATFSDENAIKDLIEESKFFIEWVAREASFDVKVLLAGMQSKLALCQRRILTQKANNSDLEDLKEAAKAWSEKLVEISAMLVV
jgi:hypothetical protein